MGAERRHGGQQRGLPATATIATTMQGRFRPPDVAGHQMMARQHLSSGRHRQHRRALQLVLPAVAVVRRGSGNLTVLAAAAVVVAARPPQRQRQP